MTYSTWMLVQQNTKSPKNSHRTNTMIMKGQHQLSIKPEVILWEKSRLVRPGLLTHLMNFKEFRVEINLESQGMILALESHKTLALARWEVEIQECSHYNLNPICNNLHKVHLSNSLKSISFPVVNLEPISPLTLLIIILTLTTPLYRPKTLPSKA